MEARTVVIALTLAAAEAMSGCAMTPAQYMMLQRETAIAVGGNAVALEQVKISEVQGGGLGDGGVRWHASAPVGEFDCSALKSAEPGGGVRQTLCVKK